jgi:hypothetical protein
MFKRFLRSDKRTLAAMSWKGASVKIRNAGLPLVAAFVLVAILGAVNSANAQGMESSA